MEEVSEPVGMVLGTEEGMALAMKLHLAALFIERTGNAACEITDERGEEHERARCRHAQCHTVEQLTVGKPAVMRDRALLDKYQRRIRATET